MAAEPKREARASRIAAGWIVEENGAEQTAVEERPGATRESDPVPGGAAAGGTEEREESSLEPADEHGGRQVGSGSLVLLGIFGGLFLVYAWIWLSWVQYVVGATGDQLPLTLGRFGAVVQILLYWLVPLAPLLWYLSVVLLQRRAAVWRLATWLVLGAAITVPLPYFVGGA